MNNVMIPLTVGSVGASASFAGTVCLLLLIAFLWFMLCWAADVIAKYVELFREVLPQIPDPDATEADRVECMRELDKLIPKLRLLGAWTRPMQKPMRRLHEKLERHGL